MNMTQQDLARLARLSGLELDNEELARLPGQLDDILSCMRTLDSLEPGETEQVDGENVLRPDLCTPSMDREQLLANAPERDGQYVLVPRAVE